MVFGVDLVEWQIMVAQGCALSDLRHTNGRTFDARLPPTGFAIESRLYAEDPSNSFFPRSGHLALFEPFDKIEGVRFDTGVKSGSEISVDYDPMIAKVSHTYCRLMA